MDQSGQIYINNEKLSRQFIETPKKFPPHYILSEWDLQGPYGDFKFFLENNRSA